MLVPNEILREFRDHNDITYAIEITLTDDTVISLTEDDLIIGGCNITRTNGGEVFPLGYVYCSQLTLEINRTVELGKIDFLNAKAVVTGIYTYGDGLEYEINFGTYTLTEPSECGTSLQLIGYDDIYLADTPVGNLADQMPMKATLAFAECCNYIGIPFNPTHGVGIVPDNWSSCNLKIEYIPEGMTYRQVMGSVALLFGANVFISPFDGQLYVAPANNSSLSPIVWGGYFDSATPYASGSDLYGGDFNPWTQGDSNSASFGDNEDAVLLDEPLGFPQFPTTDITIGGVQAGSGETYVSYGSGYMLTLDLTAFTGNEEEIIEAVGDTIIGFRFRPFEIDYKSFPFADITQKVIFTDSRYRSYESAITHIDFTFKGITVFKCSAQTGMRANATYDSARTVAVQAQSLASNAQVTANNALAQINSTVSRVDEEMQRLVNLVSNSFGVYESSETDQQGGTIYYLHDKATRAQSTTIWRMTANGYTVSTDGGQTWNAGMDAQGHAVVNIMSAVGIYADWIRTGLLASNDGKVFWNLDTGEFATLDRENDRYIRLLAGQFNFYSDNGARVGRLGTTVSRISQPGGVTKSIYTLGAYGENLALGYIDSSGTSYYYIYINSDSTGETSPDNLTQRILFFGTAYFKYGVTMFSTLSVTSTLTAKSALNVSGPINAGSQLFLKGGLNFGTDSSDAGIRATSLLYRKNNLDLERTAVAIRLGGRQGCFVSSPNGFPQYVPDEYLMYESTFGVYGSICAFYGEIRAYGYPVYGTSFQSTSDETKKDIVEWDEKYDNLLDLVEPILFTWKNSEDKKYHVGVSAQKLQKALNDCGIENSGMVVGDEGNLSVSYNELTVLLIDKVKEQQKTIESLEDRIARLERIVEGLT